MKEIFYNLSTMVARFIPMKKTRIIMMSNPSLQDNTGALFKEMISLGINKNYCITWFIFDGFQPKENYENVEFKHISNNSKLRKVINDVKMNFIFARSKFIFFSHDHNLMFYPKKNQSVVNLTHGIPLKDITGKHRSQKFVTDIITTSEYGGYLTNKTNDSGEEKIRVTGYPRNDYLLKDFNMDFSDYILWLPTYRVHENSLDDGEYDYFSLSPSSSQFKELDKCLGKLDVKLYIKPHPVQKIDLETLDLINIIVIDQSFLDDMQIHLYQFLKNSKMLITDYSSVYMDYLLTDKPILFTFDDCEQYSKEWGFTVDDVLSVTPGKKVYDWDELIYEIDKHINGDDEFVNDRHEIRELFHKHIDDQSSVRLLKYLKIV